MSKLNGPKLKPKALPKVTGVVLYDGPSALDGKPIVVVATLNSANAKTGNMIQTWILRSDIKPLAALDTGEDYSICGNCPHRKRTCYVNVGQAPSRVYDTYKAGKYPAFDATLHTGLFIGRKDRLGASGDTEC